MRNDQPDEIEHVLDSALSCYSSKSGSFGLEERILNCVRCDVHPTQYIWKRLTMPSAMLAAAAVSVVLTTFVSHRPHEPVSTSSQAKRIAINNPPVLRLQERTPNVPYRQAVVVTPETPRKIRAPIRARKFPLPSPLTEEERAVLALKKYAPQDFVNMLSEATSTDAQPIQIEPLKIEPL